MKSEEFQSPDRLLTLTVTNEDGDFSIGFAGFEWHTHGDLLAANYPNVVGLTPETATRRFVSDIVSNRAIIAVMTVGGRVRDIWITDDVAEELRYKQPEEEITFRYWDGTNASPSAV